MTDNNKYLRKIPSVDEILNNSDVSNKLETLNKESVYRRYDHQVQTNTVVPPGHDAALIRV